MSIGVIGNGFVGGALLNGFSQVEKVYCYDSDPKKSKNTIDEVVLNCEIIFVCVPTPKGESGEPDVYILEKCVESIQNAIHVNGIERSSILLVIKSTIPPGTCDRLSNLTALKVISNPEFLTERFADKDFLSPRAIIIGSSNKSDGEKIKNLYKKLYEPSVSSEVGGMVEPKYVLTSTRVAEASKYVTNTFFAAKISLMNIFYQYCKNTEIDYEEVMECVLADGRVYPEHISVPGPDGKLGFGGKCLPKDSTAFFNMCMNEGVDAGLLYSLESYNDSIRISH